MKGVVEKVREFLVAALPTGGAVGVGASGGADSTALLAIVASLASELNLAVTALHLDHNLRDDSHLDAAFVRSLAERMSLPFVTERLEKRAERSEEELRDSRYGFFIRAARRHRLAAVLTAHTADDQAETLLFRILRGTGVKGLAGIPTSRSIDGTLILRPFLAIRRSDILRYLESSALAYREDPSNALDTYARNRIRNQIIPFLVEHAQADLVESLRAIAESAHDDEEILSRMAALELAPWKTETGEFSCPPRAIIDLHPSIARRLLHALLLSNSVYPARETIDALLEIMEHGGRIVLAGGLDAWVEEIPERRFRIGAFARRLRVIGEEYFLTVPGRTRIEPLGVSVDVAVKRHVKGLVELKRSSARPESISKPWRARAFIAADSVRGELRIRHWRPGDRLTPFGMKGTKKLQDIFTDEKVSPFDRDAWPLLCDDDGVVWMIGLKQAERTRITDATVEMYEIEFAAGGERDEPDMSA